VLTLDSKPRQVGEAELAAVDVQAADLDGSVQLENTLPGLWIRLGSNARLTYLLVQVVFAEHQPHQVALLDATPSSPVSTPPTSTHSFRILATASPVRSSCPGSFGLHRISRCRLPSPS
jgi:hypothetical protein